MRKRRDLRLLVPWRRAEGQIRAADLLLFSGGRNLLQRGICAVGRSEFHHAGMAVPWDGEWYVVEMTAPCCRALPLEREVAEYPGQWHLFRANADDRYPEFDRSLACRAMKSFIGERYGWMSMGMIGLTHLPVIRWLCRRHMGDSDLIRWPVCSATVANATRLGGGVDPVRELADQYTEPGDLARSPFYAYKLTFVP